MVLSFSRRLSSLLSRPQQFLSAIWLLTTSKYSKKVQLNPTFERFSVLTLRILRARSWVRRICSFLYIPFPFSNGLPGLDCISALIELVFQSFTRYGLKKRYIATPKTTLSFSSHAHIREVSFFWGSHSCWLLIVGRRLCCHFQRRVGGGGCELQGILYQTFMELLITE